MSDKKYTVAYAILCWIPAQVLAIKYLRRNDILSVCPVGRFTSF